MALNGLCVPMCLYTLINCCMKPEMPLFFLFKMDCLYFSFDLYHYVMNVFYIIYDQLYVVVVFIQFYFELWITLLGIKLIKVT